MKEKITDIYEKILDLNQQINLLINNFPATDFDEFNEKLQNFITKKGELIEELISLKNASEDEFKKISETYLKDISEQVAFLETENLKLFNEKKIFLSEEINRTNKTSKALSGYKVNKHITPRIIDETE